MTGNLVSVVPCHNEGRHIGAVVRNLGPYVDDVVVVDDGSTDDTCEEAKNAGAYVLRLESNRGKADAVRAGLECAIYELDADEILTHLDGDGEHEPKDIPAFRKEYGPRTMVVGKRNYATVDTRKILYNMLIDLIGRKTGLQLSDPLCGFRLFGKDFGELVLERSKSRGFGLELEEILIARQNGYLLKEARLSSRYKRCKPSSSVIVKAEREIEDNVVTVLEYADFLKLLPGEIDDILYAFFGKLPAYDLGSLLKELQNPMR
jgi:glycosyltransferase involved in cell wall biosynthesis